MKYDYIHQQSSDYPVDRLCTIIKVNRSAFYEYRNHKTFQVSTEQEETRNQIKTIFDQHKKRYGSRRIKSELDAEAQLKIGRYRIRKIMKKMNLKAIQPKSFVPKTTDSKHTYKAAPNLLMNIEKIHKPNYVWVGDITYIGLMNGDWAYLATWIDIYHHKVIGWSVEKHMRDDLIIEAFEKAHHNERPPKNELIVHSDRGSQYNSNDFKELLSKKKCQQSMSRKGEVYDNAIAESFFSRLKCECINHQKYKNLEQLRSVLFEYIDGYYNTKRRHSSIGFKTPIEYGNMYYQNQKLYGKVIG